jgi:2-haloacid dehalogenase
MEHVAAVKALTFDLFGTVLDLGGSLAPHVAAFLKNHHANVVPDAFFKQWRARQRLEQFQDTIMMLGHSGYIETARRALVYALKLNNVEASGDRVAALMQCWRQLEPFPEVLPALERLSSRFRLVALSNGDPEFLDHLVKNQIGWRFDRVISTSIVGAFKPHPAVYRRAARELGLEVGECMMVSSNSFDVVGARACGFRAAFVNRYKLPYEDSPYRPDVIVDDFAELADALV